MKSKNNLLGGIIAGAVVLLINFLPIEFGNMLPVLFSIVGLSTTIYLIIKQKPLNEIILFFVLTIVMTLYSAAYIEHKIYNTENMLKVAGIVTFVILVIVLLVATYKNFKNGNVIVAAMWFILFLASISLLFIK
ncbi:hypothetical protein CLTEP_26440 [Clostridium tepidiprofundi DSM 19306]|uniref:Acid-resistance membrane protein n=1 Tax=Clostridium tepidiprofundi DSM 19306 TaxID=1121338 RepID=A0A151AS38_9CLOT|nr:hypothetical protein [Clostridium tepidiprofundi]KYH30464.1 hypothetical protein CLTEP_26440 [Clostridium tepidiprofundi DSM 19306]